MAQKKDAPAGVFTKEKFHQILLGEGNAVPLGELVLKIKIRHGANDAHPSGPELLRMD